MGKAHLAKGVAGQVIELTLPAVASETPKLAYTIPEFCEAVGLSRSMAYKEIKAQRLKVKRVGARVLVPLEEVKAWLKG